MRKNFSKTQQLAVWNRDAWHCRYCLAPVFFSPALKLLEELAPGHSYYHRNGKAGAMLPLFQWGWASVDHIRPVTRGGTNEESNLVTACWRCNLSKNDSAPETVAPPREITPDLAALRWDGLSSVYCRLSKQPDRWCRLIDAGPQPNKAMQTDAASRRR